MDVFLWNARARNTHVEATLNHPFPAQVSFVVDKPEGQRWPLYVAKEAHHTPYLGRAHADDDLPASAVYGLDADPGGALLFRGTDHVHFRRELRGEFFSAILLHYCPYEGCGA